jgi:2-polyprenyl-3-methyl-5-hydroxy-6-metoxy-1,4-benzoquinol methylase
MSHDLESSPGPADQAVANDYDSFAVAYAAETESNLLNGYYARPAVLDLAGDVAGRRILDVGCGAGPLLAALRERGAVVTGVDSSPKMLELAGTARSTMSSHAWSCTTWRIGRPPSPNCGGC